MDFRSEMTKRADDLTFIKELADQRGLPFELLYRTTNTPLGTVQPLEMEMESESEGVDEPADQEEPETLDEPNS